MGYTFGETIKIWEKAKQILRQEITDETAFSTFLGESYIHAIENGVATVVVNSALAKTFLAGKYQDATEEAVSSAAGERLSVEFTEKGDLKAPIPEEKKEDRTFFADSRISERYTFKNFVVGSSNREAFQAAVMVAQDPGKFLNPVLIYGNSGLGKTHLLHAIGNSIKREKPELKVLYVHAQEFLNEFIKFVNGQKEGNEIADWFKRNVDVLLVDDVQFLANKPRTEETFFTIYEYFYSMGKQVVLTSDQHPSKLNGLDDRLKTRFVQGLPVSISQPEKETCEAILRYRIQEKGMSLSDFEPEVIDFFARNFCQNIRELEGALDKLTFNASHFRGDDHSPVDLAFALRAVQDLIDVKTASGRITAERIVSLIADYYGLAPYQLTGKDRSAQIANARHIAMYVIRKQLDLPFDKIGAILGGRDHSTVMSAVTKVEKSLKEDRTLQKAIAEIETRLK